MEFFFVNMNKYYETFQEFIYEIFDLESDRASFTEIVEGISKNVYFRGTNLWILIFAILVASVGLNMNSTAVVIGAMLISPLMGPIIGIGLGIGIYDFDLIKKSAWNLLIAVFISVLTSTIYFWLTPLKEAQSELLGRTLPTIWDVLIAFFGGLAGIVAYTRQEKSNVIPGVAIATALMPPLCTAGFGLATGNLYYFIGAFYLFFINSVFIATATIIIVRYLKIPYKEWVDAAQQAKMRNYVVVVTILTLIPSIYLAYDIVGRSIYNRNAAKFIEEQFESEKTIIVEKRINPKEKKIELFIIGEKIDSTQLKLIRSKLAKYSLFDTQLSVRQDDPNSENSSIEMMRTGIIEEMYSRNEVTLIQKEAEIKRLSDELNNYHTMEQLSDNVSKELTIQYPEVIECSMNKSIIFSKEGKSDTTVLVLLNTKKKIPKNSMERMDKWLKFRLQENKVKILTY
ncbi:MAG: putative hydrophobic protein (TIGR00271 family) [Spirosomataceae bacterium]